MHAHLISGLERSPGEENGNPVQYSCLGNPMDRRALGAVVHGVVKKTGHDLATKQQHNQTWSFNVLKSFKWGNLFVLLSA